jgi:hypothetical protein
MSQSPWRSWWIPVAGALILAASFAPWWVLRLAPGGRLADDHGSRIDTVSAWQGPGLWTSAVGLALAVAVVWIGWRLLAGGVPDWLRGVLIVVSVAPIALTVHEWRSVPPPPTLPPAPRAALTVDAVVRPGEAFTHPGIDPDRLYRDDASAFSRQGPGWGLYAGTAGLVLLTVGLLVSGNQESPRDPGHEWIGRRVS